MATYKCALQKRFDDDGKPYCTYEQEKPWKLVEPCPGCGRLVGWLKIGADKKTRSSNLVTAGDAIDVKVDYLSTGIEAWDYVLSGGLVRGNLIQFGGVHGAGKTTLLAEVCDAVADKLERPVVFASSEQHTDKVLEVFNRIDVANTKIKIMSTKDVYEVLDVCEELNPAFVVFDSLQNFRLGEDAASAREGDEIATIVSTYIQKSKTCGVIVNQMNAQLGFRGGTAVSHLVETELMLYRFDENQDNRVMKQHLDRATRLAIKKGRINSEKLRVLICGKNRNGEEGLKFLCMMTSEGLRPLKTKSSDEDDDDEDEEPKLLSRA